MNNADRTEPVDSSQAAIQPNELTQKAERGPLTLHSVFFNTAGLRAGWSASLFVAIFLLTDLLAGGLLHSVLSRIGHHVKLGGNTPLPLGFGFLIECVQASGVVVATFVLARLERRPLLAYGYQSTFRAARFLAGLLFGFAAISALVLILWKAGLLSMDGQLLQGALAWKDALGWGGFFLIVAVFEESLLRGYLQFTLMRGLGFWWGALLLSFLFGFSHGTNPGETPVGLFSAGAIGLIFCLSLWYTGSLWWALGFHAAWDWGESYFYGTSDSGMVVQGHLFSEHPLGNTLWSGGATGPEGSLLVVPLLVLIAILMIVWWHKRGETPFRRAAWRPAPLDRTANETIPD